MKNIKKIENIKKNFKILTNQFNGQWYLDIWPRSYLSFSGMVLTSPGGLFFKKGFNSEEMARNYAINYLLKFT